MRPGAKATLYLALGLGLLAAMVAYAGPDEVARALTLSSPTYLALALVAYALFFLARALRWRLLLSQAAPEVRLSSTANVTAVGWLANSVLPFKGGDVLRAALLARRERVALSTSAASVGLERVLDLAGLAILAALGLLVLPRASTLPAGIERALGVAWLLPLAALALLAGLVRWREPVVRAATRALTPLGKLGVKLAAFGAGVLDGLHALGRHPRLLLALVPLTLLVSGLQALVFTFLVCAFLAGTPVALAFAGSTLFLLSFVVSVTPGNVGTYEAAFAAIFGALGPGPESAVPAAILTHVTSTLIVAFLGSLALVSLGATGRAVAWRAPARGGAS